MVFVQQALSFLATWHGPWRSLAGLLGSTVGPASFTPMAATTEEDGSRPRRRALAPCQETADPAETISDPVSFSWKTRLSSPCLEPPSHTSFEFSLLALNLSSELVYPHGLLSLPMPRMGCQGFNGLLKEYTLPAFT